MKTVFILGAGASKTAGAPLMYNFLDRAHDLYRLKDEGIQDAVADFEDVFDAINELQRVHAKSYLDLDNIEVVFGAIEMALLIRRLGNRNANKIKKLRNSLITLIYKTLEYSIKYPVSGVRIHPPSPYDSFMTYLTELTNAQPRQDPHEFTFITFNYDLCLDYALHFHNIRFDYCLNRNSKPDGVPLLKLHGSINWGSAKRNQIIPYPVSEVHFNILPHHQSVYFNLGTLLPNKRTDGVPLQGPPIIVPPTWNKNSYHGQLTNVWSAAARELSLAENIIVIGYSLPETDSFFRYLYALGSESSTRLRNFIVVNPEEPDTRGGVKARFKELIGKGIESRFQYLPETFSSAIPMIKGILMKP